VYNSSAPSLEGLLPEFHGLWTQSSYVALVLMMLISVTAEPIISENPEEDDVCVLVPMATRC